jgi:Domain of unknown function (DUF5127)
VQVTLFRCIPISAGVRAVVLRNPILFLSLVTEWNSGDRTLTIVWNSTSNANVIFHYVTLQTPVVFTENLNQAEWGTLYYAMKAVRDNNQLTFFLDYSWSVQGDNVTYQIAADVVSRANFTHNGVLNGQQDPNSRVISTNLAVFAISRDLGTIQTTQAPVVWTVGITTDPAINYTDLSGTPVSRSLYYKTQYPGSNDESLASIDDCTSFGRYYV